MIHELNTWLAGSMAMRQLNIAQLIIIVILYTECYHLLQLRTL